MDKNKKENNENNENKENEVINISDNQSLDKITRNYSKFILYFTSKTRFDNGVLIGIPKKAQKGFTVRLNKNESFYLAEHSFSLFGKGVWCCIKGYPYSVPFICTDIREYCKDFGIIQKEIDKLPDKSFSIVDIGYSSTDLDAMNNSQVLASVLRVKKSFIDVSIKIILMLLSVISIEYIILTTILGAVM